MDIKAAIFDIDGTLVPYGQQDIAAATIAQLKEWKQRGIKIMVATGRPLFEALPTLLNVPMDYVIAANGGCIFDVAKKKVLYQETLTDEEMYALVDFCEDDDIPLSFTFQEGYFVYVEYEKFQARRKAIGYNQFTTFVNDGQNQVRHLQSRPYAATIFATPAKAERFTEQYGYLGIRLIPFAPDMHDVLRFGVDKAAGAQKILQQLNLTWKETAAFGDGANDIDMLKAAGVSVAMGAGLPKLQEFASVVVPAKMQDGLAYTMRKLIV